MIGNLFNNMSPVVKNLVIINVLFFVAKFVLGGRGIDLDMYLSSYLPGSGSFMPLQVVTHMFMHGSLMHIFFNMFGLVIFGSNLERIWGPKRFLIYYFACGFGAYFIFIGYNYYSISQDLALIGKDLSFIWELKENTGNIDYSNYGAWLIGNTNQVAMTYQVDPNVVIKVLKELTTPMLGASGAVYGILLAFGMYFPNTQLMLLFPPIPIKAKYLVIILGALALYNGVQETSDGVAHFAHLGGMIIGFILVKVWQKDRNTFY